VQIDLLFDRQDRVITLCEIKYCNTDHTIDKSVAVALARKQQVFEDRTQTKKQIFW